MENKSTRKAKRLRDTYPRKEPPRHNATEAVFLPDEVSKCRKVDYFSKSVFIIVYMQTAAHGLCLIPAYLIHWLLDVTNKVKTYDHRSVNKSLRKLAALGFVEREGKYWRVVPRLMADPKGNPVRGKLVELMVWLNPYLTEAEIFVYMCVRSQVIYGKTCWLTDREMAEQTGFNEDYVRDARRSLLKKRMLKATGTAQRQMGKTGLRTVGYSLINPIGVVTAFVGFGLRVSPKPGDLVREYNRRLLLTRVWLRERPQKTRRELLALVKAFMKEAA
jgi:hypothetical protein